MLTSAGLVKNWRLWFSTRDDRGESLNRRNGIYRCASVALASALGHAMDQGCFIPAFGLVLAETFAGDNLEARRRLQTQTAGANCS